jgi:hypothetical protein
VLDPPCNAKLLAYEVGRELEFGQPDTPAATEHVVIGGWP